MVSGQPWTPKTKPKKKEKKKVLTSGNVESTPMISSVNTMEEMLVIAVVCFANLCDVSLLLSES